MRHLAKGQTGHGEFQEVISYMEYYSRFLNSIYLTFG